MGGYATTDIRNIAIVGGAGTGKTTLVESLLAAVGVVTKAGRIEDGNTVCDHDPIAKELHHSIDSSIVHIRHAGAELNLLDTPGSPGFIGKAITALPASETVAVVLDCAKGIDTSARRLMAIAEGRDLPRMIVVNKIDHAATNANELVALLAAIQETFGSICRPINLPAGKGSAVIDCYRGVTGTSDVGNVADFHTAVVEQIVEVDETALNAYLTGENLPEGKLHEVFEKALRERHLVPICFVSAKTGAGIKELLDVMTNLCPNPTEGNPRPFEYEEDGEVKQWRAKADPSLPSVAHVFKVTSDPYVGKLAIFRVHQGTFRKDSHPRVDDGKKPIRIAHLFKLMGAKHVEVDHLVAGDIGATSKIDEIHFNSVLHDGDIGEHMHLRPLPLPVPMFGLAVLAANRNAEVKLGESLAKLYTEDPTLRIDHVPATGETILRGLDELHLRTKIKMLKDRYTVEVTSQPPRVAYKETITMRAEGHHRHKKQTGGAGQFGEVYLRVEPLPPFDGKGGPEFEFVDDTFGGSVPRQFLPAIEKGIRQVLAEGAIAGYPITGVRVSVYDGKYHAVDSKEIAFTTAGKRAFIDAIMKAKPVLLEPFVRLEITVPTDAIGTINADLSGKRGRIQGTDILTGGVSMVIAEAPLSEVMNYANQLKSITGGAGTFIMEYSHDEQAPMQVRDTEMAKFKPHADDD
ncbi:MAG: elongation factor G [Phycisphaerae bacterium]|nr:elongation factor G [Phycisphaerae bacterium]